MQYHIAHYMSQQSIVSDTYTETSQNNMNEIKELRQDAVKIIQNIQESNRKYRKELKLMLAEERILEWIINHSIILQSNK